MNTKTTLVADNVSLRYGSKGSGVTAIENISLDVNEGEFVTIVGPSGCGKSSFLSMVAGFVPVSGGRITLDGKPLSGPGSDRGVVFQEHALFPWMSVRQNIAFGPRVNKVPAREIEKRVDELLELIGLTRFRDSWPKELSGGMKQRVAIARALANRPKMLLMDEPFAALDAQTRRFLQDELLRIWQTTKTTILFITHGIDESVLLADRVVVMTARPGRIKTIIPVPLPRPRDENTPEFTRVRKQVSDALLSELKMV
ncbi:ABC transporter ATP-binding protein [Neoaquamicrobium sediminum]|uniref:ABC transporter ATP-binding protein n=1 Tax=Neoaquamicrobium sediminum TaxID=1849104 RepID=UPI0015658369|nr:ABC transporter ATP-binding protein [Mesorhizobium sediminum]NRC57336.1 ABC transporter ATP-binding protein [Mesorhizobium sediminum]